MKRILMLTALCGAFSTTDIKADIPTDSTTAHELREVVTTGTNNATSRNLLPYTVSVIDRKQIEGTGQSQLMAALSGEVPSLFVSQRNIFGFGISNGGSGSIKIRGVGGQPTNSVLMLVDGQPQFAGLYSHPVADFYESEYVDHVEVLRGPGSLLYGSNAMGGVINVITRSPEKEGLRTTLSSQFGSYNTWQNALTSSWRKGKFSSLVSLGYDRTDGVEKNFDFKQSSLYAKLSYDICPLWNIKADYSLMNFVGNDPVYARLSNKESKDIYHQNVTRGEGSLTLSNKYGTTNGAARVYYSYGNHYVDDPSHFHSLDDRFGILLYQNFAPWRRAQATIGFDFDTYTGRIPLSGGHRHGDGSKQAQMQTISRKSITEYAPYLTLSQTLMKGALTLNGGVRMAGSDRFGVHWVPQLGLSVRPARGWNLKAAMAKGFRNPSFREMYLYAIANPDLNPERMTSYEISVGKRFSHYLNIDVTAYFSQGSNMIERLSVANGEGGYTTRNVNTGRFINKGIEVAAESRPSEALTLRASYSYLHTSLKQLTAAPKNQYLVGAAWQVTKQFLIDARLRGVGGLYVADDTKNQNYALLDLRLSYRPLKLLELMANLDNLTDASYQINKGYTMPGIMVMAGVKLHL